MSSLQSVDSASGPVPAHIARPGGVVKGGLVVIHEVWGLNEHTRDVADRFAREGYVVVAPDLLVDRGITEESTAELNEALFSADARARNEAQPKLRALLAPLQTPDFAALTTERVKACFDHLYDDAGVAGRVGVVGFCFGGSYSFSLAVHEPRLRASVPFYGHANFSDEELGLIESPVLAFYGQEDERLMAGLPELEAAMGRAGVDFTAMTYPDAGHAFFNDANQYAYRQGPAEDVWALTLEFLARHLA